MKVLTVNVFYGSTNELQIKHNKHFGYKIRGLIIFINEIPFIANFQSYVGTAFTEQPK